MVAINKNTILLNAKPDNSTQLKGLNYYLLKPSTDGKVGTLKYAISSNSSLSTFSFEAPTITQQKTSADWFSIIIKPYSQHGIGPLYCTSNKGVSIRISTTDNPIWAVDLAGGLYYTIAIRTSLLAKHALGMIDTSVLNRGRTLILNPQITNRLIPKLKQIWVNSRYSAELDLRVAHLMLAICETISDLPEQAPPKKRHIIAHDAVAYIQQELDKGIDLYKISEKLNIGEQKLESTFKSAIGISCSQFLNAYKLNMVRQELYSKKRSLTDCAEHYGFKDVEHLHRGYMKFFTEEPPLFMAEEVE